jgi:hypothetical protein
MDQPRLDQLWGRRPSRKDTDPPEIEARPGTYQDAPALVTMHEDSPGPYAVVHTPEESIHCTRLEAESMERQMTGWEPTRREKALIQHAADGAYDDLASGQGYDTPLSYILDQIQQAEGKRDSYDRQTRRFASGGGRSG